MSLETDFYSVEIIFLITTIIKINQIEFNKKKNKKK